MSGDELSICFVSHSAYGAMRGWAIGQIGGIERQQALMAKWLAGRGHEVTMITWDEGGPSVEWIDGVRMLKVCRQGAGLPGLRFVHPKWTSLNRAMRNADADVYYQNCAEVFTGQVALWCRRHSKAFVYSLANDTEADAALPGMRRRERVLFRFGLRRADRIIAQTFGQQQMLLEGWGLASQVIPMPCQPPAEVLCGDVGQWAGGHRVLWLARVCRQKRPDRLISVARQCPEVGFDMVGPIYDAGAAQEAGKSPNIRVHGPVVPAAVWGLYRQARLLLCTSDYEGFPNTFLEAWSCGVPLVSTVDPDGIVAKYGLGVVATDDRSIARGIDRLFADSNFHQSCSLNARSYFRRHHMVGAVMPRFESLLIEEGRKSRLRAPAARACCDRR